jgi:SAM-dependent MidA family methyltransferase
MQKFIADRGGRVRFDAFAREHLMGDGGFYSCRLDMRGMGQGGLPTPSFDPRYAAHISLAIADFIVKRNAACKCPNRPVTFVEIGGGSGNFKREFLDHFEFFRGEGLNIPLEFVSVEPNPNQREAQSIGGRVVEGTAQKTGLPDSFADYVFDDEVMDCLPPRCVKFDAKEGRIKSEAFVENSGGSLHIVLRPAERDEKLVFFEKHLADQKSRSGEFAFSPDSEDYWKESFRILKPSGTRLSFDYSSESPLSILKGYDFAVVEPYEVDLTHMIDFVFQGMLAKQAGFAAVGVFPLELFASQLLGRECPMMWIDDRKAVAAVKPA